MGMAKPRPSTSVPMELSKHGYVTGRPYMGATLLDITDAQTMMMYRVNRQGVYVLKAVSYTHLDVYKRQGQN